MSHFKSKLQIGKLLGSGFFGEVYSGTDEIHGQVAVKVLRQRAGEGDTDWQARKAGLLQEGLHLKAATHPNVVQVLHVVESEASDAIHLVMEFCSGGSLQQAFDAGPLPLYHVKKIATDVALGLRSLHTKGMIHRDLKPSNLLRDQDGRIKLGDFGLVTDKLVLGYASQQGYQDHVAFEVWAGAGTSFKTDVWAFGMTVYRLLHGAAWYARHARPQTIIKDGNFADTLTWLPHIPPPWRRFIRKTLNDDPDARYQNADQLIGALASLPVDPRWSCSVSATKVQWDRQMPTRRIAVTWTQHSARTFTWSAISEPLNQGNKRKLGGSMKNLGGTESDRQLREFFVMHC